MLMKQDDTDRTGLYLDLLKKTLSYLLWDEAPRPVADSTTGGTRRAVLAAMDALARPLGALVA